MESYAVTHRGLAKEDNQDCFLVKEFNDGSVLLAVADGLGGAVGGKKAAKLAKESLDGFDPKRPVVEDQIVELMQAANQKIMDAVKKEPDLEGMGTTMTAVFVRNGIVSWAHVGDCRLYVFSGNELQQITVDDTMAGFLFSEGEITKEEARVHPGGKLVFQCIGGYGEFEPDTGSFQVRQGDVLLLSTDGLHDEVPEEEIVSILRSESKLNEKLDAFVSAALATGGKDNIAVVLSEV
ncbi:MAG: serine/threonine-protein phosphatase [Deltaproteobacteria bacterium]|nr:MAG: serine/threonine-protein phosphatase [Deltaproteobacteria bacterium]